MTEAGVLCWSILFNRLARVLKVEFMTWVEDVSDSTLICKQSKELDMCSQMGTHAYFSVLEWFLCSCENSFSEGASDMRRYISLRCIPFFFTSLFCCYIVQRYLSSAIRQTTPAWDSLFALFLIVNKPIKFSLSTFSRACLIHASSFTQNLVNTTAIVALDLKLTAQIPSEITSYAPHQSRNRSAPGITLYWCPGLIIRSYFLVSVWSVTQASIQNSMNTAPQKRAIGPCFFGNSSFLMFRLLQQFPKFSYSS